MTKYFAAIAFILAGYFLYTGCSTAPEFSDQRGKAYAGSQSCMKCHADVKQKFPHNAHYRASWRIDADSGKLPAADSGMFSYANGIQVKIEKRNGKLWQAAYAGNKEMMSRPIDVVFGTGSRAMSFAYWEGNQLFQLPLSWFASDHAWANSPGFSSQHENFKRPVITRCMECHGSFIARVMQQEQSISNRVEYLDNTSAIYGIDCERCHGPAAEHVRFQQANPGIKTSRYITHFASLSRQQQMDACGVCHSGNDLETQRTTFAFVPGDTLSHFYYPEFAGKTAEPDVHGKQLQLLQMSMCFQKSGMTCNTCHDVHENEKGNISKFVTRCVNCHSQSMHVLEKIKLETLPGKGMISTGCIDCHMPLQPSKAISFSNSAGVNTPYLLRTHKIAIYQKQ